MTRRPAAVALLAATALVLAACGTPTAGRPTPVPSTQVTVTQTRIETSAGTATVTSTATVTKESTIAPTPTPPPQRPSSTPQPPSPPRTDQQPAPEPDLDATIKATTATAFNTVNTYWANLFSTWHDNQGRPISWQPPARFNNDGFYDSGRGWVKDCDGDFDTAMNAFFCGNYYSGTGFVAWDLALFREEVTAHGDGAIYATVAHEVGHAAQARFWHDGEGLATPDHDVQRKQYELQADCFAGATLHKAEQDGYLVADPDRYVEIIASYEALNQNGDHGSDAERVAAYILGYRTGDIESCLYNQGVPPAPELA